MGRQRSSKVSAFSTPAKATSDGTGRAPNPTTAPPRISRRQRHASPDFELHPDSKAAKKLFSDLILDPEAVKRRRERKFAPGERWVYEKREGIDGASEDDDEDSRELPPDTKAGGKRGRKRKASQHDQGLAGPSRGSKVPRRDQTTTDDQQKPKLPIHEPVGNKSGKKPSHSSGVEGDGGHTASARQARAWHLSNADEKFVRDCIQQMAAQRPNKGSMREVHLRTALSILKRARQPSEHRTQHFANIPAEESGDKPDLYLLDATEAKRLLESDLEIHAPVFVPNGARERLFAGSKERPIEQFLRTWLLDESEVVDVTQSAKGVDTETIAELRKHFLEAEPERLHPWNTPDIVNPRPESCLPHFLQSLNCNLLRDVVRRALDATADEICPEICPNAHGDRLGCSSERHKLTRREYHCLMEGWEHWQGTAMLAEPGAITISHWDRWGMGTWISCHEGEIGVTWRSYPSDEEIGEYLLDGPKAHIMGTTLYKVIRPGDALYMSPGTIHTVFRRPSGNQTLGFAGHILRRASLAQWLHIWNWETRDVESDWHVMKGSNHEHVVPPLARALRAIVGERGQDRRAESFEGRAKFQRGENQVRALEAAGGRLQRLAFVNPPAPKDPSPEQDDDSGEEVRVMPRRGRPPKKKPSTVEPRTNNKTGKAKDREK